jgi:gamma-glutamylcysteine synthetase
MHRAETQEITGLHLIALAREILSIAESGWRSRSEATQDRNDYRRETMNPLDTGLGFGSNNLNTRAGGVGDGEEDVVMGCLVCVQHIVSSKAMYSQMNQKVIV